jgi:hypothetical protein
VHDRDDHDGVVHGAKDQRIGEASQVPPPHVALDEGCRLRVLSDEIDGRLERVENRDAASGESAR